MVEPHHHARQEAHRSPTAAWPSTACATATWWSSCSTNSARATQTRNGGYLRILKSGFRKGDNAPMALVELMDRPAPVEEARDTGDSKVKA